MNVSGTYDAGENEAQLSWTVSTDAKLTEYEVCGVAGPNYNAEDESVVTNISKNAPREWAGAFGLGVPGSQTSFRIYVVTRTGNARQQYGDAT